MSTPTDADAGASPAAAPGDRGWWLDANRTWHRGTPRPGWWQAHDGLWHPPAARPIPLPPYAEPYWEPTQDTAEMRDMADILDTTEPTDLDGDVDIGGTTDERWLAAAMAVTGRAEPTGAPDAPAEAPTPAAPAEPDDLGDTVVEPQPTTAADGDRHDLDDGVTRTPVDAAVPDTVVLDGESGAGEDGAGGSDDDATPARHMAPSRRARSWRGAIGDEPYDDEDDWDDGAVVPAWMKMVLPLAGVICVLAFLAVAVVPGGNADGDETRTDEPPVTSSTSTTSPATSARAPSSAPTTTLPGTPPPTGGRAPASTAQPGTTAAPPPPSSSTAPPASSPPTTASPSTPPPVTNTPQPDPNCEPLGLPLDLCRD